MEVEDIMLSEIKPDTEKYRMWKVLKKKMT
jgi:hypothetical protein